MFTLRRRRQAPSKFRLPGFVESAQLVESPEEPIRKARFVALINGDQLLCGNRPERRRQPSVQHLAPENTESERVLADEGWIQFTCNKLCLQAPRPLPTDISKAADLTRKTSKGPTGFFPSIRADQSGRRESRFLSP